MKAACPGTGGGNGTNPNTNNVAANYLRGRFKQFEKGIRSLEFMGIFDTGCSASVTPHRELLHNFRSATGRYQSCIEGAEMEIQGIGDLHLAVVDVSGFIRVTVVPGVRFSPDSSDTLLSVAQLMELESPFEISGSHLYQRRGKYNYKYQLDLKTKVFQKKVAGVYSQNQDLVGLHGGSSRAVVVELKEPVPDAGSSTEQEKSQVGTVQRIDHSKISHYCGNKRNANASDDCECVVCALGKARVVDVPVTRRDPRSDRPTSVITLDFTGGKVDSVSRHTREFVAVDDYSKLGFVKPVRSTSEAPDCIQAWRAKFRPQGFVTVYCDHDPSFVGSTFADRVEKEYGYELLFCAPHEHHGAGLVERRIRTLDEATSTVLLESKLPAEVWTYAYAFSNHCYNCSVFSFADGAMSPWEKHFGTKPPLERLHPFGCLVVAKDYNRKKGSFDPRGEMGIHLGPDMNSEGCWHVLLLSTGSIVTRRSLKFFDKVFPDPADTIDQVILRVQLAKAMDAGKCQEMQQKSQEVGSIDSSTNREPVVWQVEDGIDDAEWSPAEEIAAEVASEENTGDDDEWFDVEEGPEPEAHASVLPPTRSGRQPRAVDRFYVPPNALQAPAANLRYERPNDTDSVLSSISSGGGACQAQEVPTRFSKGGDERRADAIWRLSLLENATNILGYGGVSYLENAAQEVETKDEERLSGRGFVSRSISWVKKQAVAVQSLVYSRFEGKVFNSQQYTAPVPIPHTVKEVMLMEDQRAKSMWTDAINAELTGLFDSGALEPCERFQCRTRPIKTKMVFTTPIKEDEQGNERTRLKARLVVLGCLQQYMDVFNTYAPTIGAVLLKIMTVVALSLSLKCFDLDFTQAFLQAAIGENEWIYIEMPNGLETGSKFYRLKKSLYGLSSSPIRWFQLLCEMLLEKDYVQSEWHPCLFTRRDKNGKLLDIVCVFVDDLKCYTSNPDFLKEFIDYMRSKNIEVTPGKSGRYLGMKWDYRPQDGICTIDQEEYISEMAVAFGMEDSKPINTPAEPNSFLSKHEVDEQHPRYSQLVGKLIFALQTRFDCGYSVSQLARHMQKNGEIHWKAAKRVLRYLNGTKDTKLVLRSCDPNNIALVGYTDAAWRQKTGEKGTTGGVLAMGCSAVGMISRTQHCTSMNSCEAEIYAGIEMALEILYYRRILDEAGVKQKGSTIIYTDSESSLPVYEQLLAKGVSKVVDGRLRRIHELVMDGIVTFKYMPTGELPPDVLTKNLPGPQFQKLNRMIMNGELPGQGKLEVC